MEPAVTAFVCPPGCRCECATGGPCEHEWRGRVKIRDTRGWICGESSVCSRCGVTAMSHDLRVLP